MSTTPQTIALAGTGDLAKHICTALLASPSFTPIVLSRSSSTQPTPQTTWFSTHQIPIHKTDYSVPSLLDILNTTKATTLISLINDPTPTYTTTHTALLTACQRSTACKRLIPSEYIGDTETHPLKPPFYARSRAPFRHVLRLQTEIEWTLFNVGWLMDYFLPAAKTHMRPAAGVFPIDLGSWTALVRGSGEEVQSWTCGRDVGRAVVALCGAGAGQWESHTYVAAEWSTFNSAIKVLEKHYGRPMAVTYRSWESIQQTLAESEDPEALEVAQIEEMMVMGCLACPREKTLRQREKFFPEVGFLGLEELLAYADGVDFV
ncbi:hypothetical protein N7G274_003308 [Stereocaulon virgatum]|uniref:NAD(P)-binding protein n=1 Tax=Stereocaulon virgatum TaxID=373712 RepID=A0ABR4AGG2_9LECA